MKKFDWCDRGGGGTRIDEELEPYFDVWRAIEMQEGFLAVFVIEHDAVDGSVPRITKGTDGRALI